MTTESDHLHAALCSTGAMVKNLAHKISTELASFECEGCNNRDLLRLFGGAAEQLASMSAIIVEMAQHTAMIASQPDGTRAP